MRGSTGRVRRTGTARIGLLMLGLIVALSVPVSPVAAEEPADTGVARTVVDPLGRIDRGTSVAVDSAGLPVVSYQQPQGGGIAVARCHDRNCTNRTITVLEPANESGPSGAYPSLVLDANGYPVVSYYDPVYARLKLARCHDAVCADRTITAVWVSTFIGPNTSLALDAADNPVIAYQEVTHDRLVLVRCHDQTCIDRTFTIVDSQQYAGWVLAMALDAAGNAVIAYAQGFPMNLVLAKCHDAVCSSRTRTVLGGMAWTPVSIALDASDHPVIGYVDGSTLETTLARCNDSACVERTATALDVADTGWYSSVGIDTAGNPVLAYHDPYARGVKLARCQNRTCTDRTTTVVDDDGYTGGDISLALDADSKPVISYTDLTRGGVMLARCSTIDCRAPEPGDPVQAAAALRDAVEDMDVPLSQRNLLRWLDRIDREIATGTDACRAVDGYLTEITRLAALRQEAGPLAPADAVRLTGLATELRVALRCASL